MVCSTNTTTACKYLFQEYVILKRYVRVKQICLTSPFGGTPFSSKGTSRSGETLRQLLVPSRSLEILPRRKRFQWYRLRHESSLDYGKQDLYLNTLSSVRFREMPLRVGQVKRLLLPTKFCLTRPEKAFRNTQATHFRCPPERIDVEARQTGHRMQIPWRGTTQSAQIQN